MRHHIADPVVHRPHWREPEDDQLRLECGVCGVWGADEDEGSAVVALGLHALQHRGQEACGIASVKDERFYTERHQGLVGEAFGGADLSQRMPGRAAVGHTRYSTAGGSFLRNIQPMFADLDQGGIAIAHNGNLTNFKFLHAQLVSEGAIFQSTSDSEVILHLIARSRKAKIVDRFIDALARIEGGYALVAQTRFKMIGARDPLGIRPLVLGQIGEAWVLASETCALDMMGATFVRDVEHGEIVVIDDSGLRSLKPVPARAARPCLFEYVYFSRPDSVVNGRSVYEVRKEMGRGLARELGVEADIVVPVPDSGVPAALGYAQESGIPYEMGIIRSHYLGRTFIQPSQGARQKGVRMKHSPNKSALAGKRIVLIDDSIVRGTTSVKIVRMMRDAGAKEVHFRISSPPITHPDYYGIDTPQREKLLAATHNLEQMREYIGCDTLAFLSVDGIYRAMGEDGRNPQRPQFTDHCFTGDYPTVLTDVGGDNGKQQLSLLAEAG